MGIGASLFLVAIGAILAFAVHLGSIGPVSIATVGIILLVVGAVGLVLSLLMMSNIAARRRDGYTVQRDVVEHDVY